LTQSSVEDHRRLLGTKSSGRECRAGRRIASLMVSVISMATMVVEVTAARVRAAVDAQAPERYEDESGFHFGTPPFKN